MSKAIKSWFPTQIYNEHLWKSARDEKKFHEQILLEVQDLKELDTAGQRWSKKNYRNGFTSYASVNNLHKRSTTFELLEKKISQHVAKFIHALEFDLGGKSLQMNTCWANIMGQDAHHGMHLHPLSVISGTYYVSTPKKSSAIKFEDPRLSKLMAAPPRKDACAEMNRLFVSYAPKVGDLILFESWLRHEVPLNVSTEERVSISFNYDWE